MLWISPWLAGLLLLFVIPAGYALWFSLCDYSLLSRPVYVGLENYRELLGDERVWRSGINSAVYAVASVIGATGLSLAIAVLLDMGLKGSGVVRAIVFAPTLVPVVSACVVWGWLFNQQFGLINTVIRLVTGMSPLEGPDWIGSARLAMPSLIVMSLWTIGSSLMIASAALRDVPRSLYEAASIDGMGALRRLWHVTIPMISPALLFNALMSVVWSLQVFAQPQIMTKGGPGDSTITYSMSVYAAGFVYGRMGYACALAWVQALVIFAVAGCVLLAARRFVYYRAA